VRQEDWIFISSVISGSFFCAHPETARNPTFYPYLGSELRIRVFRVGRLELFHKAGKEFRPGGLASGRIMIHEIAAAAAENLANRRR